MRAYIRPMLILLVLVGATRCSSPSPSGPGAADPRGQVVTLWYPAAYEEALIPFLDRFNAQKPWGIALRGMQMESSEQIYERLLRSRREGKLPDLVVTRAGYLPEYVAHGLAVDLTPYLNDVHWGFPAEEQQDFYPAARALGLAGDPPRPYGFPLALSAGLLVYNRAWLHELGYDTPPHTWEDLRAAACAAAEPQAGIYGLEFAGDERTFFRVLLSLGGRLTNEEGTAYTFGDDAGLTALTLLQDLVREGCARPEKRREEAETDFSHGRTLFVLTDAWHLPHYGRLVAGRAGFEWGVSPVPAASGAAPAAVHGALLVVLPTFPQRQLAAWTFIRWLNEPAHQAEWTRETGYLPHRRAAVDLLAPWLEGEPQYAAALALLEGETVGEPKVPGFEKCRDHLRRMVWDVLAGAEPSAALRRAEEACNATAGPSTGNPVP